MAMRVQLLKLEFMRAWKRLPHMAAGAVLLIGMMGMLAFAAGKLLYGDQAVGRIAIGVVLPREDKLAEFAVRMLGSLDSVDSLCDFSYMEEEEAKKALERGEIFGIMNVPSGLVEGIMDGSNPPVSVILPSNGLEGAVFKELTMAGARTLSAAQAGIYAGDQLLARAGQNRAIPRLEEELNKIFMYYSLPRADYFQKEKVSAYGEVDSLSFYGVSALVLFLFLEAIPVSGYLAGEPFALKEKLRLYGVGPFWTAVSKLFGLELLLFLAALLYAGAVSFFGYLDFSVKLFPALFWMSILAGSVALFLFSCSGSLLGGVMGLSTAALISLFLSGGLVPLVFLPEGIQNLAPYLPTSVMLACGKAMVLGDNLEAWWKAGGYAVFFLLLTAGVKYRE